MAFFSVKTVSVIARKSGTAASIDAAPQNALLYIDSRAIQGSSAKKT
jgi:hypothetical protein